MIRWLRHARGGKVLANYARMIRLSESQHWHESQLPGESRSEYIDRMLYRTPPCDDPDCVLRDLGR